MVLVSTATLASCTTAPKGADRPQKGDITVQQNADGVSVFDIDTTELYRFVPAVVRVKAGKMKLTLVNGAKSTTHSLAFKSGTTAEIPYLNPDSTKSIEFSIGTPGTYKFFCTFHEALNQTGKLIVSQ